MLNILGIILGLAVLIVLVFRKMNLFLAVFIAVLICGLTNGLGFWTICEVFAGSVGEYFGGIIMVFFFASIYGQVLTKSGGAASISYRIIDCFKKSKYTVLAIPVITAILVYGGISVFVVVFTVMPIGVMLMREANLNKSMLPGLINFGATTFAMTCLPGSPQLTNLIPSQMLGTSPMASPMLGIIGAICMVILGVLYYRYEIRKYIKKGYGFDQATVGENQSNLMSREECPPAWKAIVSILTLLVIYLGFANGWFGVKLTTFTAVNTGMIVATLIIYGLNSKKIKKLNYAVGEGAVQWIMPLIYLCAVIGLGAVIKQTPGYTHIVNIALNIPGNVYVSAATSTTLVAGITGSASGGIQIALESLADSWLSKGGTPEVLHRICAVASGGLDSLPHAGGLFTVFAVCNENHRSGYYHLFYSTVMIPLIVTIILVICASFGIV